MLAAAGLASATNYLGPSLKVYNRSTVTINKGDPVQIINMNSVGAINAAPVTDVTQIIGYAVAPIPPGSSGTIVGSGSFGAASAAPDVVTGGEDGGPVPVHTQLFVNAADKLTTHAVDGFNHNQPVGYYYGPAPTTTSGPQVYASFIPLPEPITSFGAIGPTGPTGADGPAGPAGATGPTGPGGTDGGTNQTSVTEVPCQFNSGPYSGDGGTFLEVPLSCAASGPVCNPGTAATIDIEQFTDGSAPCPLYITGFTPLTIANGGPPYRNFVTVQPNGWLPSSGYEMTGFFVYDSNEATNYPILTIPNLCGSVYMRATCLITQ